MKGAWAGSLGLEAGGHWRTWPPEGKPEAAGGRASGGKAWLGRRRGHGMGA